MIPDNNNDPILDEFGDPISSECFKNNHDECKDEDCNCHCHQMDDPNNKFGDDEPIEGEY